MKDVSIKLITSTDALFEITEDLLNADYLAVDTETTGLERTAKVVGVCLATSANTAYYIPITLYTPDRGLFSPWSEEALGYVRNVLNEAFTQSKRLLTHNGTFDAKVIYNTFGIQIMPYIFADTQLLHHTAISEERPHGLKALATIHISDEAANPQEDLKESVIANGGKWTKDQKDFYKGDWKLLGTYGAYDVIFTRRLFDKFYPELLKDARLVKLWNEEVMPLMQVTYDLNVNGLKVDVEYFTKLKQSMLDKVKTIEDEIYVQLSDKIADYELKKMLDSINITPRSEFGRFLKANSLFPWVDNSEVHVKALKYWYSKYKNVTRMFNLDSPDDKAFLLYDVLKLPVKEITKSGKRATSKAILDSLAEQYEESSAVLKLLRERSKELKLLSTYVEPILETHIDGRIYPSFNQTGTTSGRYSCGGESLNMQTLPRDDTRIKSGFLPDEGEVFIGNDYQSLEPHIFAFISGENILKETMRKKLDFYSSIAINVLGLTGVSSDPKAENYLGKVDKEKRQFLKAIALSIPYGASAGRLAQMMQVDYEEAHDIYNKYLKAFPKLKQWMDKSDAQMKVNGYVESIVGRRKRNKTVHLLYKKYGVKDFSKQNCFRLINKYGEINGITDGTALYLECRNALNVAKNHQIQSLSASVINAAAIAIRKELLEKNINAKIVLNVHDEMIFQCKQEDAEIVAEIMQRNMENNNVTALIDVPLKAEPVITDKSLAEAK
jgi:DNA polymerase I-like protein with 3'-5' exonuclease and polymerase domains